MCLLLPNFVIAIFLIYETGVVSVVLLKFSRFEVGIWFVLCTTALVLVLKTHYNPTRKCKFVYRKPQVHTLLSRKDDTPTTVVFVDVPFAGGRTVLNILSRSYSETKLNLVGLKEHNNYHFNGSYFLYGNCVDVSLGRHPFVNIKGLDGRGGSPNGLQAIAPNRTVHIGILRSPFEQFISTISFLEPDYIFKINSSEPVETFLEEPLNYEPKNIADSWTNNKMAFDFGFHPKFFRDPYNRTEVKDYIGKLGQQFHLVIIREFFDESIILMKRLLNLTIQDVLYISDFIKPTKIHLPSFTGSYRHRQYAKLDYDLYYFFYERLHKQIKSEGEDFQLELQLFKSLRTKTKVHCNSESKENVLVHRSLWSASFNITSDMCKHMNGEEPDFS